MSDGAAAAPPPLRLEAVARRFRTEAGELPVLSAADLTLEAGEIVALVAPSGTGKSTLLHLAGLLERPDAGEVHVAGRAAGTLSDDARTAIRREFIGFVYQFHHLLPEFSAEENVLLARLAAGAARAAARARARELLAAFGLSGREVAPPRPALGRRAAARRHRPRARQRAARAAGRRADRQPRRRPPRTASSPSCWTRCATAASRR